REGGPVLHGISLPLCLICGASLARGAWRKNDSKGGKGQEGGSELSLRAIPAMHAVSAEIVSSRVAPSQRRREIGVIEVSASPPPALARPLPRRSTSPPIPFPNPSGVDLSPPPPALVRRSRTVGSARLSRSVLLSFATTAGGMPRGANTPYHVVTS